MSEDYDNMVESIASELRDEAKNLSVDAFVEVFYTLDFLDTLVSIAFRKYSLNQSRLGILYYLVSNGGSMKPSDLSRKTVRPKQTITSAVDSLEKAGLVTRELISEDRRARKVKITRKGLELVKETIPDRRQLILAAMSSLNQEEKEQLSTILKKLRRDVRKQIENSTRQITSYNSEQR